MSQAIVTESKLTAIANAIRSKTGGSSPLTLDDMATEIANISGGGGGGSQGDYEVLVLDYDGTIIDQTFLNANDTYTLPTPPTHTGLTFVDWSCNETITNNEITIGESDVMIGANYTTTSGLSEFDITLTSSLLTVRFYTYSGYTVDWGDGTSDTASSSGYITHTYSNSGNYTIAYNGIKIYGGGSSSAMAQYKGCLQGYQNSVASFVNATAIRLSNNVTQMGTYTFAGTNSMKYVVFSKNITAGIPTQMFRSDTTSIKHFIIPNGITTISSSGISNVIGLKYLVIPKTITTLNTNSFSNLYSLKKLILPVNVNKISMGQYMCAYSLLEKAYLNNVTINSGQLFSNCYNLESATIKNATLNGGDGYFYGCVNLKNIKLDNIATIRSEMFSNCTSLEKIKIPKTVTNILSYSFSLCISLIEYDFTDFESVPTLSNVSAFEYINPNCKMYVPDSLYTTWIAASNWSAYASYIYRASDRS